MEQSVRGNAAASWAVDCYREVTLHAGLKDRGFQAPARRTTVANSGAATIAHLPKMADAGACSAFHPPIQIETVELPRSKPSS